MTISVEQQNQNKKLSINSSMVPVQWST